MTPYTNFTPAFITKLTQATNRYGQKVIPIAYTVNDLPTFRKLKKLGIRYIMTDDIPKLSEENKKQFQFITYEKMIKKFFTVFFVLVSFVGFGFASEEYLYFYGNSCSHCIKVENYFSEQGIEKDYTITKYEVFANQENRELL